VSSSLLIVIFVAMIVISVPIGVTIAFSAFLPNLVDPSFPADAQYVIRSMIGGVDSFPILAIPLFIFSGIIMARGGVSKKLFETFAYFLGNKTAGMPAAVIITSLFYGAISGSSPATTAAVGAMTIPLLTDLNYDKTYATAIVAVSGGLGVIIPPSIPFILFGMATGTSVGKLFLAGIIPGILIGLLLIAYVVIYAKVKGEDKEKLKAHYDELHERGFLKIFKDSFWALLAPVIILGSIYSGVASPTEAATISVFYSLFVSIVIYKTLKVSEIVPMMKSAIHNYATLLFILAAAVAFGRVLSLLQVPQLLAASITSVFDSKIAILLIINLMLLFIGMIMDGGPAILILAPILTPIAITVGVDPVQFGIIMVTNLAIGFVTPPMGINLFVASSLTGVPVDKIARQAVPLIVAFLMALMLITFIPQLSLFLAG